MTAAGLQIDLAGMRGAGTILAVNTDPEAAIFGVAHLGSSCDLHDVLDELELVHADDSAVGAYYGSNVADLDGDGTLDLALGTFGDISRQGLVHVVYGFGG